MYNITYVCISFIYEIPKFSYQYAGDVIEEMRFCYLKITRTVKIAFIAVKVRCGDSQNFLQWSNAEFFKAIMAKLIVEATWLTQSVIPNGRTWRKNMLVCDKTLTHTSLVTIVSKNCKTKFFNISQKQVKRFTITKLKLYFFPCNHWHAYLDDRWNDLYHRRQISSAF